MTSIVNNIGTRPLIWILGILRFLLRIIEYQLAVHRRLLRQTKFGSFVSWMLLANWLCNGLLVVSKFPCNVIRLAGMNFIVLHTAVIGATLHSTLRLLQRGALVPPSCVQIFAYTIFLQFYACFIDGMTLYLACLSHTWRTKGTLLLVMAKIRCNNLLFRFSILINFISIYRIFLGHLPRQFCALSGLS